MQAIVTKYLQPTNYRDARVVAECSAGRLVTPWDDVLEVEDNHSRAAVLLVRKLGWETHNYGVALMRGGMPDKSPYAYVFVFTGNVTAEQDRVEFNDPKYAEGGRR